MELDLSQFESVRQFVRSFKEQSFPPLRDLVCNAGANMTEFKQRYTKKLVSLSRSRLTVFMYVQRQRLRPSVSRELFGSFSVDSSAQSRTCCEPWACRECFERNP